MSLGCLEKNQSDSCKAWESGKLEIREESLPIGLHPELGQGHNTSDNAKHKVNRSLHNIFKVSLPFAFCLVL